MQAALTGLAAATALLAATDEIYQSSTSFYVAAVPGPDQSPFGADNYVATRASSYALVVEGEAFREDVVSDLSTPASDTYPSLSADFEDNTALLIVTVTDTDPERALEAATAVTRSLPGLATTLDPAAPGGTAPIRVQPVEPPVAPEDPVAPNEFVYLAGGLILGVLVGLAGAVTLARADQIVRRTRDLRRLADPPVVLGLIAVRKGQEQRTTWVEGFRTLYARLLYYSPTSPRTVVITSAIPGEGKTLVATELAMAAARSGQRVLLLGADLRRPAIGTTVGVPEGPGLAGVVLDDVALRDALEPTSVRGLDALPAGRALDNPLRVLTDPAFETLLDELSATYDLVVIDAPPVLPVADAALLAARAHSTVLVAGVRRVRLDQLTRAQEQLARAGATLVGTVLNGVRQSDLQEFSIEYVATPRRHEPSPQPRTGTDATLEDTTPVRGYAPGEVPPDTVRSRVR